MYHTCQQLPGIHPRLQPGSIDCLPVHKFRSATPGTLDLQSDTIPVCTGPNTLLVADAAVGFAVGVLGTPTQT